MSYFKGNAYRSSFWIKCKRGLTTTFKGYTIIASVAVLIYVIALLGARYMAHPVLAEVEVDNSHIILAQKIETLKNAVVTDVGPNCESKGRKTSTDPVIILDTNNKASIGVMQWQVSSIIHYYKTLYKRDLSAKEAVLVALDDEKAMALAKSVMFDTKNKASKDWYTCANKMNADARIDIIKSLE